MEASPSFCTGNHEIDELLNDFSPTATSESGIEEMRPSWQAIVNRRIVNGVPVSKVPSLYKSLSSRSRRSSKSRQSFTEPLIQEASEDEELDRIKLASQYINDALEGHNRTIIEDGPFASAAATLQRNPVYKLLIRAFMLAQLGLLFVEPVSRYDDNDTFDKYASHLTVTRMRVCTVELCILGFLAMELYFTYKCLGRNRFCRKKFNLCYLATLAVTTFDILFVYLILGYKLRPTRALRPLFIISHVRWLRQQLSTILKTIPKVFDLFRLVIVMILCYAIIGVKLFKDAYHDAPEYGLSADGVFDNTYSACVALSGTKYTMPPRASHGQQSLTEHDQRPAVVD
ncbi:hypothetical protein CYMTET_37544 [Cymbomonas tetramitiformis]|uniref:Ion transport domain-containing protein n=1 Tax=Cymbomonas tetramitiformis TaxID=36881 RepID=A0AAE0F6C3_9CHLO|nr:hypothetical protein CYMTET_37544 [Cymbomonas tetramitiformis]